MSQTETFKGSSTQRNACTQFWWQILDKGLKPGFVMASQNEGKKHCPGRLMLISLHWFSYHYLCSHGCWFCLETYRANTDDVSHYCVLSVWRVVFLASQATADARTLEKEDVLPETSYDAIIVGTGKLCMCLTTQGVSICELQTGNHRWWCPHQVGVPRQSDSSFWDSSSACLWGRRSDLCLK